MPVAMSCPEWQQKIETYIDGELPAGEMQEFRAHTQSCAGCASQALAAAEARLAVRSAGQSYSAPAELRTRVARLIAEGSQPRLALAASAASTQDPAPMARAGKLLR